MKKSLRKIYSVMLVVCMVIYYMTIPVSAEIITGATAEDPNLIYFRDFEGETHLGDNTTRLAANNTSTDWVWSYSGSTFKTETIDGSTVMVESGGGGDSNVYRLATPVTSGRFYLSMDIGYTNLGSTWTDAKITFYTKDYPADNGGGYDAFNQYGRGHVVKINGRNGTVDPNYPNGYLNAYVGSPGDGFNTFNSSGAQEYLAPDKLHRLEMVYNLDANWCVVLLDGNTMLNSAVPAAYAVEKITAIGLLTQKGMFFDNIRIATKPDNSFDAAVKNLTATSFDLKFNQSVYSLEADNVLINNVAATSVSKKDCNTYTVVCAEDPRSAEIELVNVKNFMNESPKTTVFDNTPPVVLGPEATVILETTNAVPTDVVPMGETLKVNVAYATPTAYQWHYKNSAGTAVYDGDTDVDFVVPAKYVEMSGDCEVWCDVTYEGGVLTTPKVKMDMSYEATPSWGYDNKYNGVHYGPIGVEANSNSDYTFEADGKKFVLAKEQNVKGAAYFIVAADAYGDIYLEGTRPEGTEGETRAWKEFSLTSGGFVNDNGTTMETKLLGEGNDYTQFNGTSNTKYALPDIFDAYIDMDHSWPYVTDKWGTVRSYNAGVTVLSFSDFKNYSDRIGYRDNLFNIDGVDYYTLLRDYSVGTRAGVHTTVSGSVLEDGRDTKKYQVRPCFWLTKDFFEKNVIDLAKAGGEIIKLLKNADYVNQETLRSTYEAAGRLEDYDLYLNSSVSVALSTRSGAEVSAVKLLDTLSVTLTGLGDDVVYGWQISGDNGWEALKNGNELALTHSLAGKRIRATAAKSGITRYSDTVTVPSVEASTEIPGIIGTPKTLNNPQDSDADKVFTVDGRGFVLLEEFNNDEQTYYVTTTDSYGSANVYSVADKTTLVGKKFSAFGTFIGSGETETNNLMYHIMNGGNDYAGVSGDSTKYALPEGVVNNIYNDTVWNRYRFSRWSGQPETVIYPINMLSQTDMKTYEGILGYKDNVFEKGGAYYLLRDTSENAVGWFDASVVSNDGKSLQLNQQTDSEDTGRPKGTPLVRPAFYLSGDFFKNVKIDIETAGRDIIDIMKAKYYVEDLAALGYAEVDLENAGFRYKINMGTISASTILGAAAVTVNVPLSNANGTDKLVTLMLDVYDANGKVVGLDIQDVIIPGAVGGVPGTTTATCTATVAGSSGTSAMVMLWNGLDDMVPLTKSKELN